MWGVTRVAFLIVAAGAHERLVQGKTVDRGAGLFSVAVGGGQAAKAPAENKSKEAKPKPSVQVKGRVVDGNGQGVANAELSFTGPKRDSVATDAKGSFIFKGPAGEYAVTVRAGSKSKLFKATVANDKLEPATLILD